METPIKKQNIFVVWAIWHFYEMPRFLFEVWKNYIFFALNYFSVLLLLKSFFSPWRKYRWNYPKGFQVKEFLSAFFSNTFSRILGAGMRTVLIVVGIFFQIFVVLAGLIAIIFWMLTPFIIIGGVLFFINF